MFIFIYISLSRGGEGKQILIHINDPNLAHRPTDLDPDPNKNPDRFSLSLLSVSLSLSCYLSIPTDSDPDPNKNPGRFSLSFSLSLSLFLSLFLSHTIFRGVIIFLPPLASFTLHP